MINSDDKSRKIKKWSWMNFKSIVCKTLKKNLNLNIFRYKRSDIKSDVKKAK